METEKVEKENNKKKGFRVSLAVKIGLVAVGPIVLLAVILTLVASHSIESGMEQEVLDGLGAETQAIQGGMDAIDDGDYTVDADNNLFKGAYNVTEHQERLDEFVEGCNVEITFFYGNTRYATTIKDDSTGERIVGTTIDDDEIVDTVLKKGELYETDHVDVKGMRYYGAYHPVRNDGGNGDIIGMYSVLRPAASVEDFVHQKERSLILIVVLVACLSVAVVCICVFAIKKAIAGAGEVIEKISHGDLSVQIPEKLFNRGDELGDISKQVHFLQQELSDVLGKVHEASRVLHEAGQELSGMASQTSSTADEIGHAVEDISKGAVSQAEEIETASSDVSQMGDVIEQIVDGVATLDDTSINMKESGDQSASIISDLSASNDRTMKAIQRIGEQVDATNESANKISEAIQLITSIAEETNLLSLNASIEAARAGEQGRGFAVVANQIQKLAEQSNDSAQKVGEIVENLLEDSKKTVAVMEDVRSIVDEQHAKLNQTKSEFEVVQKGINLSREETSGIREQTDICDNARIRVVDVISNLSAISQQNAAATQQTTASMQELNATINLLAEAAGNLTNLSDNLASEIAFFKI